MVTHRQAQTYTYTFMQFLGDILYRRKFVGCIEIWKVLRTFALSDWKCRACKETRSQLMFILSVWSPFHSCYTSESDFFGPKKAPSTEESLPSYGITYDYTMMTNFRAFHLWIENRKAYTREKVEVKKEHFHIWTIFGKQIAQIMKKKVRMDEIKVGTGNEKCVHYWPAQEKNEVQENLNVFQCAIGELQYS